MERDKQLLYFVHDGIETALKMNLKNEGKILRVKAIRPTVNSWLHRISW